MRIVPMLARATNNARDYLSSRSPDAGHPAAILSRALRALLTAGLLATPLLAAGQQYPNAPVRIVVPFPAGSGVDLVARIVVGRISGPLGQPIVFENRVGAGGNVGTEYAARAPKDGYTLLFNATQLVGNPGLGKVGYDAIKDFAPVTLVSRIPALLVVPADSPAKTVQELIALARSKPGALSYASGGNGGIGHFAGELFKANGGNLNIVHVPYKSAADQVLSVVTSTAQLAFPAIQIALPQVRSGKVRALGVTTARRSPALPDVPTMMEAMSPGFVLDAWYGLLAPAGTPADIINRLNAEVVKALREPAVRDVLIKDSHDIVGSTPAEFAAVIVNDLKVWGDLAAKLGARVD
jgi:tripartite-type tricarboxylate transporter receptor subunit TctC